MTANQHISMLQGTFSTIDLTFSRSNVASMWLRNGTQADLCDSDHFPVITKLFPNCSITRLPPVPRWKFESADWAKYRIMIESSIQQFTTPTQNTPQIDLLPEKFTEAIRNTADNSILKSTAPTNPKKSHVSWWNKPCDTAIKNTKHAFNKYKQRPPKTL